MHWDRQRCKVSELCKVTTHYGKKTDSLTVLSRVLGGATGQHWGVFEDKAHGKLGGSIHLSPLVNMGFSHGIDITQIFSLQQ